MQILLTTGGLRVESRKIEGLFSKTPGRTGIFACGSSDLDLMALDEEVWRSNLGRGSEIERLRVKGARAAALAAPAASLAAAACRSSSKSTLRGSNRVGIWPGTVRATRANHLGQEWDTGCSELRLQRRRRSWASGIRRRAGFWPLPWTIGY